MLPYASQYQCLSNHFADFYMEIKLSIGDHRVIEVPEEQRKINFV